ncbi:MAG: FG-GAP-like repeat-containing protein [Magnetovibrio sp.]|nr:FG-GAP-like repeat-containing protein [Magnetovibrio sp.]
MFAPPPPPEPIIVPVLPPPPPRPPPPPDPPPPNRAPEASSETLSTVLEDAAPITGRVVATDPDGNSLTYSVGTSTGGFVTMSSSGQYTFTLDADYNGTASFTFTASDGLLTSNEATVRVDVTAVNDAPEVIMSTTSSTKFAMAESQDLDAYLIYDIESFDIDGDGDQDILFSHYNGSAYEIMLGTNNGSGTFTFSTTGIATSKEMFEIGDVDNDGDVDIVTTANSATAQPVYFNDGSGTFSQTTQQFDMRLAQDLKLADMNGDGLLDIVTANTVSGNTPNKVIFNNFGSVSGQFSDSGQTIGNNDSKTVDVGDIDGDGDIDAVFGNWNGVMEVYVNDGSGNLTSHQDLTLSGTSTLGIRLGDLDGDGDLDAFLANRYTKNFVLTNNGSGTFTDSGQTLGLDTGQHFGVDLGDLDGDGDLDAVTGNFSTADEFWINDGTATFTEAGLSLGSGYGRAVLIDDFNGDGQLDVILGHYGNNGSGVILNNSVNYNDTMTQGGSITLNSGTTHLSATDIDSSGTFTYTVTSIPTNGTLKLNGTALSANDTFTQAQVDAGNVVYTHAGTSTTEDSFVFAVSDGTTASSPYTFNLEVNALGAGTHTVAAGESLSIAANITPTTVINNGTFEVTAGAITTPSTVTNNATMNITGGSMTSNITNAVGGVINYSSTGSLSGTMANYGTIYVTDTSGQFNPITNYSGAVLDIGAGVVLIGAYNNVPNMQAGSILQGDGQFKTAVQAAYTYNGILNPGTDGTIGSLELHTWDSNYGRTVHFSSTTVLNIDISGTGAAGTNYDLMTLTTAHASTIDGTLNLKAISGYTPTAGDTFTSFFTYNTSSTGEFSSITHDFGAGWYLVPSYGATSLTVTVQDAAGAVTGTAGADTLVSLAGNDTIDGGAGTDTLILNGAEANYKYGFASDGTLTLTDGVGTDGTDTISNVETLHFTDGDVTVTTENAEYTVSTSNTGQQGSPAIAYLESGGHVIVWYSNHSGSNEIYGQIYDAAGIAVGSEFQINTIVAGNEHLNVPKITALKDGGFAVSWNADAVDGSSWAIASRIYNADGSAATAEFQVNTTTSGAQEQPSVAQLHSGELVYVWTDNNVVTDGDGTAIVAQRVDTSGNKIGGEFVINSVATNSQGEAEITALDTGGYAVTWHDYNPTDGDYITINTRIYDSSHSPVTSNIQVNTHAYQDQSYPDITTLNNGNFVVAYTSNNIDGAGAGTYGVGAQIFTSAGATVGSEIVVNTTTAGNQETPRLAALEDGGFVVTWEAAGHVYAQLFNASGTKVGSELQISTSAAGDESRPNVAETPDGGFIVTWRSDNTSNSDVYAQRFDSSGNIVGRATLTGDSGNNSFDIAAGQHGLSIVGGGGTDTVTLNGTSTDTNMIKATDVRVTGSDGDDIVLFGSAVNNFNTNLGAGKDTVKLADVTNIETFHNVEEIIGGTGNDTVSLATSVGDAVQFSDDFEDGSLTGFSVSAVNTGSSVTETGGNLELYKRAIASTDTEYAPSSTNEVVVKTSFTMTNTSDVLSFATRSDGVSNPGFFYATQNGIIFELWTTNIDQFVKIGKMVNGSETALTQTANNSFAFAANVKYDVEIRDDGTNLSITISDGTNSTTVTATDSTSFATNKVAAYNSQNSTASVLLEDFSVSTTAEEKSGFMEGGSGTDTLNLGNGGNSVEVNSFETINGGTGTDTLTSDHGMDLRGVTMNSVEIVEIDNNYNSQASLTIDAATSFTVGATIRGHGGDDTIVLSGGGSFDLSSVTLNDISEITGSAAGETIIGSAGADTLFGGDGIDTLTGGNGVDTFKYTAASQSATGSGDSITDFVTTVDKIDVSSLASGSFSFGTISNGSGFTVQAQQTGTKVELDTNDDGVVDMEIDVGGITVAVGDFVS